MQTFGCHRETRLLKTRRVNKKEREKDKLFPLSLSLSQNREERENKKTKICKEEKKKERKREREKNGEQFCTYRVYSHHNRVFIHGNDVNRARSTTRALTH